MVFKFKKAQDKALKKLEKHNRENPGELDQNVMVGERSIEGRSEEHTSELQSQFRISYAVFCLKKKNKKNKKKKKKTPLPY